MTDKEKLDFIEDYVRTLLTEKIGTQLSVGRFGMSFHRLSKADNAYLDGEVNALDKVRECIKSLKERKETEGKTIMNDWREEVCICCKNCKHREKYTKHCSLFDRDILLTDYCSMSVFEERDDVPNCNADVRGGKGE